MPTAQPSRADSGATQPSAESISRIYTQFYGHEAGDPLAILDADMGARSPEFAFDLAARAGLGPGSTALDIGCGFGNAAARLCARFGCRVAAVDPVPRNLERSEAMRRERRVESLMTVTSGSMEAIPFSDAAFDFVWSRDMVSHVADPEKGFRECARVLKPGGRMLCYASLATELLHADEAERLYPPLGVFAPSMSRPNIERAMAIARLEIEHQEDIGNEISEHFEPINSGPSRQFTRLAKLVRHRDRLIAHLGRELYEYELAGCTWGAYVALGKITYRVYLLRK